MTTTDAHASADPSAVQAFAGAALSNFAGTMTTLFCIVGDKLGLLAALAEAPATSAQLAERTGLDERYLLEWLRGLSAAGYLEHDRGSGVYTMPAAHVPVLADEGGPFSFGGVFQETAGALSVLPHVIEAFRGGGVPQDAYGDDLWIGMERFTGSWFDHLLVQQWVPAIPGLGDRLDEGASVADVGCGAGRAVIKLAETYPRSRFVGYDAFEGQLRRARANADAAGVADRVRFEILDAAGGLPGRHDVITTFDVVHDAVDPLGLVSAIRRGLADDGLYLMLEINCADDHADNAGPLAATFYGFSLFYCMTTLPGTRRRRARHLRHARGQGAGALRGGRVLDRAARPGRQSLQHPLRGSPVGPRC